jgi:nicotinamide mononucleotide (NMN) deamidase PncC
VTAHQQNTVGYQPEEVQTAASTRAARLKWVIVLDSELPAGRAANAAVCVAAATASAVSGLLGPEGKDADGTAHAGLPWAGCSILATTTDELSELHRQAQTDPEVFVADMPSLAQETRVYDEFLEQLSQLGAGQIHYYALSLVGPRKHIDKLVGKLRLLP